METAGGDKQASCLAANNDKLRHVNHTLFDLWIIRSSDTRRGQLDK